MTLTLARKLEAILCRVFELGAPEVEADEVHDLRLLFKSMVRKPMSPEIVEATIAEMMRRQK